MKWLRLYTEVLDDPKILSLSYEMRWHWMAILCVFRRNPEIFSKNFEEILKEKSLKFALRVTENKLRKILEQLINAGLIDRVDQGLTPHNWDGRQYQSDTSAERTRRYRRRKCDVTVTPPEYRDTDIQKEKKDIPEPAARIVYGFERGKIRLTQKDLDAWQSAFTDINLLAELEANYEWAAKQKNWFIALKGLLAKRNREAKLQREAIKVGVALAVAPRKVGGGFA